MKRALSALALAGGAMLCVAATGKTSKSLEKPGTNWNGTIAITADGSHRLGNPDAPVKLTEFVSYTCSHCAHYQKESDPVLRLTVIPKGQVSVTVTNLLRNPIDLTVALLTNCGDPKRFFVRHNAFFATQDTWLAKAQTMSKEQEQRWFQGPLIDRMRAISNDFGFYTMMSGWGMDRAQTDACLGDATMLDKLRAQQEAVATLGINSTPSFTLNGEVLTVHDWASVSKAITDKLAEQHGSTI
ncbi:DsbA family protein [Novosphingobium mangrovi (ex Huang et al. 2023)]|uniref:DsbA family protein n=1 Tax=Novosphingobium mangrovi (ex Huang et al. 2023) TaxID=2976432 RepID=A0ABT2I0B9_9SPHN|nr:DsbA family protein [Novosphingobium mangrovi (ex Huang et al. 2023)]MCT2398246.1 DsbA family protein [Novosphingobium mangrovi (ex Huang et al. 2023)]